jgi:hypothetical protein
MLLNKYWGSRPVSKFVTNEWTDLRRNKWLIGLSTHYTHLLRLGTKHSHMTFSKMKNEKKGFQFSVISYQPPKQRQADDQPHCCQLLIRASRHYLYENLQCMAFLFNLCSSEGNLSLCAKMHPSIYYLSPVRSVAAGPHWFASRKRQTHGRLVTLMCYDCAIEIVWKECLSGHSWAGSKSDL